MNYHNSAQPISVRNPRSGEIDYEFTAPSSAELASLACRLKDKQPAWQLAGVESRIKVLRAWQESLLQHQSDIVAALTLDTGRNVLATQEFFGLMASIDRWCELAPDLLKQGSVQAKAMPDVEIFGDVAPYPLLGAISPWNFPLLLSFIDVTPALLAGCGAVIKPSEVTPRFAEPLAASIAAVPELNEVLAIIPGDGATGADLIQHADVIAFTGSVATGRKVAIAAAENFIPAFLELGGKDPVVVLPGADLDRATTSILRASVSATGQACQSLERIYVHESDLTEFTERLVAKTEQVELTKDDPNKGSIGPLIFARQAEIIQSQLQDALSKGAKVEVGGEVIGVNNAYWVAPTVLSNVNHGMKIMTEETFGPVMPIMAYSSVEEAIRLANDTVYGLSAAVFAADEASALEVARQINAGGVSVNDAGMTSMVFETAKNAFACSGMGPSRVGPEGLTRFLRRKSLYVNRGNVTPQSVFDESSST